MTLLGEGAWGMTTGPTLSRRKGLRLWALAMAAALTGGCASNEYFGISLTLGRADPALQALAIRALKDDKRAQFELGMRFENGVGVPRSLIRAKSLYHAAASDSLETQWIYTPPVGNGSKGQATLVETGRRRGLAAAKQRLEMLGE